MAHDNLLPKMKQVIVPENSAPGREERRALIERIVSSQAFESSERLRSLFLYLAERSDAEHLIREQEIGIAVFGRSEGYDTSHDALVRVQISNLRKKLQQYFDEVNPGERWEIHIPKGNYALLYRPLKPAPYRETFRQPEQAALPAPYAFTDVGRPPDLRRPSRTFRERRFWVGAIAGIAFGLAVGAAAAGLFEAKPTLRRDPVPAAIASHPIWG
jgi:hypothetical protein